MYDSISLTHNSKYGQHFVAAKEIQPGEQIFISKPYVMIANDKKFHSYCAHCVNVLWSSVPCENCNFSLYCSQECKDEAQNSYHDIECRCLQFILAEGTMNYYIHVAVRSVIKGVKEFGSIKNLLEQVKQVDYQPGMTFFIWHIYLSFFFFFYTDIFSKAGICTYLSILI